MAFFYFSAKSNFLLQVFTFLVTNNLDCAIGISIKIEKVLAVSLKGRLEYTFLVPQKVNLGTTREKGKWTAQI